MYYYVSFVVCYKFYTKTFCRFFTQEYLFTCCCPGYVEFTCFHLDCFKLIASLLGFSLTVLLSNFYAVSIALLPLFLYFSEALIH